MAKKNRTSVKVRRQRTRRNKRRVAHQTDPIAHCTLDYAFALTNPFRAHERGTSAVCVPDAIVLPSNKRSYYIRGTFETGANGYGVIKLNPLTPSSTAATGANVAYSTSGNTATASTSFGGAPYSLSNHYFPGTAAATDYSSELYSVRTCAAGLRVRYAGTELNRGGTIVTLRMPDNQGLGGYSYQDAIQEPSASVYPVKDRYVTQTWRPATASDTAYQNAVVANYPLAIAVHSPVANQSYYYEAIIFVEEIGRRPGSTTVSHSDPAGYGASQALAQEDFGSFDGEGWSLGGLRERLIRQLAEQSGRILAGIATGASQYVAARNAYPRLEL